MFERERHPLDVTYAGKALRLYARELGYLHVQEIFGRKHEANQNTARVNEALIESIENEDATKAFPDAQALRDCPRSIYEACVLSMLKAQGIEDKANDKPVTEGNAKRSRTSGTS